MKSATSIFAALCLLYGGILWSGELETRYWKALNEGRDVSSLTPILTQLAFPPTRQEPLEALRQQALVKLDAIESADPLLSVVNQHAKSPGKAGGDWPTLGGNVTHAGVSMDPGPVIGEEVWRHPVGWPWRASAYVEAERVYTATPALNMSLLCLDLANGRTLWTAENPEIGSGRQCRAASSVFPLNDNEFAIFKDSHVGYALSYLVVNRRNGGILRRVPAVMQEKSFLQPEPQPEQLVAHRIELGRQVLVKSLSSGRTWWRFPTGYLPDEPLLAWGYVFAATEDGTLWALHLWGNQRVAWTFRNPVGWGAKPVERHGVLYLGGNDGAVYALETKTGKLLWKTVVARQDARARALFSSAAVSDNRVYLGSAQGMLHALNAENGQLLWQYDCGDWIRACPHVARKTICAATLSGEVVAVLDKGGRPQPIWSAQSGHFPVLADLSGDEQHVLVNTSDFDLVAYHLDDGKLKWRKSLIECTRHGDVKVCADSMPDIMQAPVTVGDGRAFFSGRTGFVIATDARSGELHHQGGRPDSAAPILADGKVIVPSLGATLLALDAKTGLVQWEWKGTPWRICNVTAATDGQTVLVSNFGNAYEFPFDVNNRRCAIAGSDEAGALGPTHRQRSTVERDAGGGTRPSDNSVPTKNPADP